MPYEPIKVSAKAFLVNLVPSKPKNFPLASTMVVSYVATKYDQIPLEQILKSWQLCNENIFSKAPTKNHKTYRD